MTEGEDVGQQLEPPTVIDNGDGTFTTHRESVIVTDHGNGLVSFGPDMRKGIRRFVSLVKRGIAR